MPGYHHFDIALSLNDPEGTLARALDRATRAAMAAAAMRQQEKDAR